MRNKAENKLKSSGYVIDSLESSLWYVLEKENYIDNFLGIINLGGDTDTGAAIARGLAGLYYGEKSIPRNWLLNSVSYEDIDNLINTLLASYQCIDSKRPSFACFDRELQTFHKLSPSVYANCITFNFRL
ncbi:MAG: ADP-ribosylglycohydrolase family protein [Sphingobacterium sp.]|nr:ADP-ribosylglycohydrolase family protein [Sphingobacterium sp.]